MKVLVLAEYYPREHDSVRGIWAHRQALAARRAGAEIRVLVLHRPLPSLHALRALNLEAIVSEIRQPRTASLDGVQVQYLRYLSPPRPWSYGSWGAWAAPQLRRALARVRSEWPFELVHAHYAVPAGDAVRRAAPVAPLIVSVHGGDVHGSLAGSEPVRATLQHAALVLANSAGTARRCEQNGARSTRVVHLGADLPKAPRSAPPAPTLVTVGHLIARKRHADVIDAVALLRERHPELRYVIVGDGPERARLEALATARNLGRAIELRGQLPPEQAIAVARDATLFVMPSVDEAFGVSYIEAMAAGVPAVGCRGEDGPEEIAAAGGGIELVAPRDPRALAAKIDALLSDPAVLERLSQKARQTVAGAFTWEESGLQTLDAYNHVLRSR